MTTKDLIEQYGMTEEEIENAEKAIDAQNKVEEEKRKEIAKNAKKLTRRFIEGKDYREEELVRLKDGSYYKVDMKPLSDEEIYEAFDAVGIETIPAPGTKVNIPQIKFARLATRLAIMSIDTGGMITTDELKANLDYGETTRIGTKILTNLFKARPMNMEEEAGTFRERDE